METLRMSGKERKRLVAMGRVERGELTLSAAAEALEVSYRQVKRIWARYEARGDAGLVHGLRGKASNRKAKRELRERAVGRYREEYSDYGPTLAAECLAEEGIEVAVRRCVAGCWRRGCGSRSESGRCIVAAGRGGSRRASWCSWMARTTTGSRGAAAGPC